MKQQQQQCVLFDLRVWFVVVVVTPLLSFKLCYVCVSVVHSVLTAGWSVSVTTTSWSVVVSRINLSTRDLKEKKKFEINAP